MCVIVCYIQLVFVYVLVHCFLLFLPVYSSEVKCVHIITHIMYNGIK